MNEEEGVREQTLRWHDPETYREQLQTLCGLDFLTAALENRLPPPPFAELAGFRFETVEKGRVTGTFTPGKLHYNPLGTVHGGLITTALDTVMASAVHTLLPAGRGYTTLELKVNFLRAVTVERGPLRAMGQVIQSSRQTVLAEARLTDDRDRLFAYATSTCLLLNVDGSQQPQEQRV